MTSLLQAGNMKTQVSIFGNRVLSLRTTILFIVVTYPGHIRLLLFLSVAFPCQVDHFDIFPPTEMIYQSQGKR